MSPLITPRVAAVADLLRRFNRQELEQLVAMVPDLREPYVDDAEDVVTHFRQRGLMQRSNRPPSADDLFIGGLTYAQCLALSPEERDAFWEQVFADPTVDMEATPEADITENGNISAG